MQRLFFKELCFVNFIRLRSDIPSEKPSMRGFEIRLPFLSKLWIRLADLVHSGTIHNTKTCQGKQACLLNPPAKPSTMQVMFSQPKRQN